MCRSAIPLIMALAMFAAPPLFAQDITVSGTVTDAEDGEPLSGANIVILGTSTGVTTDSDGTYSITVEEEDAVLVYSFIGYERREEVVDGRTEINVELAPEARMLSETVVTAFGVEQERRQLGYSVQGIDAESIAQTNQPNMLNAMRGRVSGVSITSSSGAPGAGTEIIIRGVNSLNPGADNQPLFVVDGIPVSNQTDLTGGRGGATFTNTNRFADINPHDIESISVLKGPAASALYGLRAGNGAVIITTKSGRDGQTQINFRSSVSGTDVATRPPMQETYGQGLNGVFREDVYHADGPPIPEGETAHNQWDQLFQTGLRFQNDISVRGGSDIATFYGSLSRSDESGVLPNASHDRTSLRVTGSLHPTESLNIDGSLNYVHSNGVNPRAGVGGSGVISYASRYSPDISMEPYRTELGEAIRYSPSIDNPFFFAEEAFQDEQVNRVVGNVGIDYQVADWLNVNYRVGADHYTDRRFRQAPPSLLISATGSVDEQTLDNLELNSNLILSNEHEWSDDFRTQVSLGNQVTYITRNSVNGSGTGYVVDGFHSINNLDEYTVRSFPTEQSVMGVFGEIAFNWRDEVYVDFTGRNDWSSTLPEENRSFFYGSASLAYAFSETLGLSDNPYLNFGKIRLSYAEVGKDASPYQIGNYYSTLSPFRGIVGVNRSSSIGADNLRPERTRGFEAGIDLGLLENRIRVDANLAIETSVDQIVPVPVSRATGFTEFVTNTGELRNTSLELLLDGDIIQTNNFRWSATVNWSRVRGEVISMPEGLEEIVFQPATPWVKQRIHPGGSPGDWYGWTLSRVEDEASEHYGRLVIQNGYPDVNDNWTGRPLAEDDYIGNAFPDWEAGLENQFSWGNFDLSFLFTFRQGGDVFDINRRMRYGSAAGEAPTGGETALRNRMVVFDGVVNEGTIDDPVWVENDQAVRIGVSDLYSQAFRYRLASEFNGFQDASWIRLQNANLSYTLPATLTERLNVQRARVSLTGHNLWLTTPFVGFDPEQSAYGPGSNVFGYVGTNIPATRSVSFGIDLTF